jgi:cephalosporin hydroxylase
MSSSALVIAAFHQLFHNSGQWVSNTKWMGVSAQKCPLDLWIYQEIIHEVKPNLIIETGTCYGGSALFMAHILDLLSNGQVITVDLRVDEKRPKHCRIRYIQGSSVAPAVLATIDVYVKSAKQKIMVVLDSDHSKEYVLQEMNAYAPFVTRGSYLIVEDTDVNGHPIMPEHGPGPSEAVAEFLKTHPEFEIDTTREKFMLTQNPGGYLRRV